MENNDQQLKTIVYGMGVVFTIWLSVLSYNVFTTNSSKNLVAQAKASLDNQNTQSSPIQTTDANQQPPTPQVKPEEAANIQFNESTFDFGTLTAGDKASHIFKFKNTSNNPLIISNAAGSCGCTVPKWPREPIAPGAEGEIQVEFNSAGKSGPQAQTVTLTANTLPAQTQIQIKAEVINPDGNANPVIK